MRYFHAEHESAYRKIEQLGYTQWNDLFDESSAWTYDNYQNRSFLKSLVPRLDLPELVATSVFEYGCGTGPAACFLAGLGFEVVAVDLVPEAINVARRMAEERGVHVSFSVANSCAQPSDSVTKRYDIALNNFCLQSIATDKDRDTVFLAVRTRLKPSGDS